MTDTATDYAAALSQRPLHALYCDDDDYLRISVLGAGTQVVDVSGRLLDCNGCIKPFDHQVAAPASRVAPATIIRKIGKGWLLNVTAIASTAGTGIAQTMVTVDLVRGPAAAGGVTGTLIQGPVSSLVRRAWPGSPIASTIDGPGVLRSITGTNPAAGAQISEAVPTGARWRFKSLLASLVTDANAATREVVLQFDDGTTVYAEFPATQTQITGLTRRYYFGDQRPFAALQQYATIPVDVPEIVLAAGHRMRTVIQNGQVGDDWAAPQYLVEELLEGA